MAETMVRREGDVPKLQRQPGDAVTADDLLESRKAPKCGFQIEPYRMPERSRDRGRDRRLDTPQIAVGDGRSLPKSIDNFLFDLNVAGVLVQGVKFDDSAKMAMQNVPANSTVVLRTVPKSCVFDVYLDKRFKDTDAYPYVKEYATVTAADLAYVRADAMSVRRDISIIERLQIRRKFGGKARINPGLQLRRPGRHDIYSQWSEYISVVIAAAIRCAAAKFGEMAVL